MRTLGNEPPGQGPYEAVVVNYLDNEYNGTLEVELLYGSGQSGNQPGRSGQIFPVRYLSPFYGVTPQEATNASPDYQHSQKSYGMWAVPPDLGTRVLVVFTESGQGFWIGCVQDDYMNFMLPGNASTEFNVDKEKRPVAEVNKNIAENYVILDKTKVRKPVHTDQYKVLHNQGLDKDETRGTTTSSARRDIPSAVFGLSTPGPVDKRKGAPKYSMGPHEAKATIFTNRLGGSSFVMDDGDDKFLRKEHPSVGPLDYARVENGEFLKGDSTRPHNELIRLRTRTGHQILMHNSEDLIYIGNARGTSWIEMTSDGKIDIFASDSVSIHTEEDFNFKADRDVNIEAGRNVNIKANNGITMESIQNFQLVIGNDGKITTGNNFDLHTENNNKFTALFGTTDMLSGGVHTETASVIHHNGPQAAEAAQAFPLETHTLPGEDEVIMKRVPQAEPWIHHENLDGSKFKPSITDRSNTEDPVEDPKPVATPDTFRKGR